MEAIMEIRGLKKSFKDFSLKGIDITLEKGYIMGFIGPNGAGKTTTIKLIMNILKRDAGEIKIFGLDNIKNEMEIKQKIGFVYDGNHYYEELTVSEMKWVVAPFYKTWDDNLFKKYIGEFKLPLNKKIKDLSKGMKMKFSLAIALSHDADLLIMDEPTSGLDPLIRSELLDVLLEIIQDENKAVFFSTHITSDLDKVADYVTLINDGEILISADKEEIHNNYGLVRGSRQVLDILDKKYIINVKENQYGFEALVKNKSEVQKKYKDSLIIEKPNLEDIMLYYTRRWENV